MNNIFAVTVLTLALTLPSQAQQIFDTNTKQRIRVVTVATGLVHPWSIAFLPDGRTMLVAERAGRLRIIRDGVLDPKPVWQAPPRQAEGSDNLHAVAVHPRFAQNRFVYLTYPKFGELGNTLAVARGRLDGTTLT